MPHGDRLPPHFPFRRSNGLTKSWCSIHYAELLTPQQSKTLRWRSLDLGHLFSRATFFG
eukprot:CAMPEP_0115829818 /NCGR_PEP_ID=MMETSP0287-20121206/1295_1 /TAXON_ID=412157 /ORGANISM="Chrysochromulina rotalis, Strain UIO044" /LENGTH=58 /DNA_ID=CAMNT_0003283097 /DNA_START=337 /DNA_END=510 /DNA_ORIENTATION=+